MKNLRELSGNVIIKNRLVSFLYDLMRDKVSPGIVEELLVNAINVETTYTNGWLAKYAEYVADSLVENEIIGGYVPEGTYGIWCDPIGHTGQSNWLASYDSRIAPSNYKEATKEANRLNHLNSQWNYYAKPIR